MLGLTFISGKRKTFQHLGVGDDDLLSTMSAKYAQVNNPTKKNDGLTRSQNQIGSHEFTLFIVLLYI